MSKKFMTEMKKLRDRMKGYEAYGNVLSNADFIKLVDIAERAKYLEKGFKEHYKNVCRKEASKPYDLYDPTEIQALQSAANFLGIKLD